MSTTPQITKAIAPAAAQRAPATVEPQPLAAPARGLAARVRTVWLPRAGWTIGRTGRTGLVGVALLVASALFLVSTQLPLADEVKSLRAELASAQGQPHADVAKLADPSSRLALPGRAEIPTIVRQLFTRATQARLEVDAGRYEISSGGTGNIARYQIAFPVTGPYPAIRSFIDRTLAAMPAVGLSELSLDRKTIADSNVDAQIRMTVYVSATAAPGAAAGSEQSTGADRVVAPAHAAALFAPHSWYVAPPPPPPPPAPPPPQPTAPPFPYAFVGSFTPDGHPPVFFLSKGDRVIDAHVGDRIDGVYQFESAVGGQLVFVYLPLNFRQTIQAGAGE